MSVSAAPATLPVAGRYSATAATVAMLGLAALAAVVHSYNMFGFPLYLGDEGIYMSQAYAVAKLGQLTPYPYWYDHAPAGWILIAIWTTLTGGFHTFGTAIDSGRTLMLLLHVASLVLLFRILLHLTRSSLAATLGGLLYALSPLTVIYGRMVLLDNVMVVLLLAAILLLVNYDGQLWRLFLSSLLFGASVLAKESAGFLLPVMLIGVWTLPSRQHTAFARGVWTFGALATLSLYPLYAALRGELIDLSLSSPLGGDGKVTLLGAVLWQLGRSGGAPWAAGSDFFRALTGSWLARDPWLLGLGLAAIVWNLISGDGRARLIALLGLVACLSLARGSQVLDFYVIGILPFMALNCGLAAASLAGQARSPGVLVALIVGAAAIGFVNLRGSNEIFTLDMTTTQRQALDWVRQHVPTDAQVIIDDDLWVDLRDGPAGQPSFPGAHSHWKVANDPAVHRELFADDWRNIDYLIMTPGLEEIFKRDQAKLPYQAWSRSTPVARFKVGEAAIEVRRVNNAGIGMKDTVRASYESFMARYVSEDGRVIGAGEYTDVRDQAGAMLMAVWYGDRRRFDELWRWAQLRLQGEDGRLFHTNEPGVAPRVYADANADAAVALLLAERRWSEASYGREGLRIARALWASSVVEVDGKPFMAAGDWAIEEDRFIFEPGSFAPYAYRLFAAADPEHDWWWLLDNSYDLLTRVTMASPAQGRGVGLPPTYVAISRAAGTILPDQRGLPGGGDAFTAEAAQVYWRVALDGRWDDDGRAERYLDASGFLRGEWARKGALAERYSRTGTVQSEGESVMLYSAALPLFLTVDADAGHALYASRLSTAYTNAADGPRWGDGASATTERWAWLAAAYYLDVLDNAWEK